MEKSGENGEIVHTTFSGGGNNFFLNLIFENGFCLSLTFF